MVNGNTTHKSMYLQVLTWPVLSLVAAGCGGKNTIKIRFAEGLSGSQETIGLAIVQRVIRSHSG